MQLAGKSYIIIPVYQAGVALLKVITELRQHSPEQPVVVVDDGSTTPHSHKILEQVRELGVTILTHPQNLGKGEALKTGFRYFLEQGDPSAPGVVTADADGQHRVTDILKLSHALEQSPNLLHLGVRKFRRELTPWRSRFGNLLSILVFRRVSHVPITDTQSGLRGIPRRFLPTLIASHLSGYEFELEMLLEANQHHINLHEIAIQTIYEGNNAPSHFRPLLDSLKIYFVFLRFSLISILSALLDYTLFSVGFFLLHRLFIPIVSARILSALFNFSLNKNIVFKDRGRVKPLLIKYISLALALVIGSYLLTKGLYHAGVSVYIAKLIAEFTLFVASFIIQRVLVFR